MIVKMSYDRIPDVISESFKKFNAALCDRLFSLLIIFAT